MAWCFGVLDEREDHIRVRLARCLAGLPVMAEFQTSLHRYCGLAVFLSIACRIVIDANSNWHAEVLLSMFQGVRASGSSQRGVTHKRR
jgi:hypothetical protein